MAGFVFKALTPATWGDFEDLFGARGACGGCWCMVWRLARAEFERGKGEGNRAAMKRLVEGGGSPGVLAYDGGRAVGWCSVAPREEYPALARSRTLRALDDRPVWSVSCLFVRRGYRRRGVSVALLEAACEFAASRGGRLVEGYPVVPKKETVPDVFVWTGLQGAFERAGFTEVARPSEARVVVRRELRGKMNPGC